MKQLNEMLRNLVVCRNGMMGIAMIAVIAYHGYCWIRPTAALNVFKWGFIGVDMFLLVSAFGLCYSWQKHSISKFYGNRVRRIFPLYAFKQVAYALLGLICGSLTFLGALKKFVLGSTTLFYYYPGCNHDDWFIPALIVLYLAFPFLYKMVDVIKARGVMALTIGFLFAAYYVSPRIGWYYDCLMSRIPAFLLGILIYRAVEKREEFTAWDILLWFGVFVASVSFSTSRFFVATMVCPIVMLVAALALSIPRVQLIFEFFGLRSFELFLGHAFGFRMARSIGLVGVSCPIQGKGACLFEIAIYIIFATLGSVFFLLINALIKKVNK